jgi:hypothetical protein
MSAAIFSEGERAVIKFIFHLGEYLLLVWRLSCYVACDWIQILLVRFSYTRFQMIDMKHTLMMFHLTQRHSGDYFF